MNSILIITIIGLAALILSQRYIEKNYQFTDTQYYEVLKKKVLNKKDDLPIMWVYIPYRYNARSWCSFGSRGSFDLNQPYLNLTIKSIIKMCDKSFKICLIDDNSFEKLLPKWNIDISKVGEPGADYIRQLGLLKLVYHYGGMALPVSFLCLKNLNSLFKKGCTNNNMFVVENIDRNVTSVHYDYYPDITFMGAEKPKCRVLGDLIEFTERMISSDYTAQFEFLGEINRWCNKRIETGQMNLIPGNSIGIKTIDNSPVLIEDLLGTNDINMDKNMCGIYIPQQMLLKRTTFQWFIRSSQKQVLEGNYILSKYFLKTFVGGNIESFKSEPDWVSYWRVPLRAPVWGLIPNYLGNDVPRQKFP